MGSSKYQTTEYNRRERVRVRIVDLFGAAKSYHSTHAALVSSLSERIYQSADWKRLRSYDLGYLSGVIDTLYRGMYAHLEWRVSIGGELVKSDTVTDWSKCDHEGGRHVWKDRPECIY